ncbi:hypothetical protein [Enterocloster lavalensis]|uniref:Uncharacterized protein n=1 Tax=Enterocloster lavalensis TaxID=460384 RepID=A0A1I0JMS0_9FIRM|nr:hypothetical protein [Enterocloster lavalensis]SEU11715.1 hypothetical protein SAMN05216313_13268 [Enterocloster lavalensis]
MMIKAKDLQPGQVIRVEYGDYGNWQKFCVEAIKRTESKLVTYVHSCDCNPIKTDFSFRLDEEVEVIADENAEF